MFLGSDDDTFDGFGGTVSGTIDGEDGSDTYFIDQADAAIADSGASGTDSLFARSDVLNATGIEEITLAGAANPALYGGVNFNAEYVFGPAAGGGTSATGGHLAGVCHTIAEVRGANGYLRTRGPVLGNSAGIMGQLARTVAGGGATDAIALWGIDNSGSVTGTYQLRLPVNIDDCDGFSNDNSGINEFNHYRSQTAFRGGVAQVALGQDQQGNILVAAQADHPAPTNDWPLNYIAVARVSPADLNSGNCQNVQWTMAGYISTSAVAGKPILDGPGGNQIGQMVPLAAVTGGAPLGPSVSSPMIDSVGNVYFLSAIERFDPQGGASDFGIGLLRAVYSPATFCYELELLFDTGSEFAGLNSATKYLINFMGIADSNSVSSGTAFSQNISQTALANADPANFSTQDSRTLGGLVLNVSIIYDVDGDGNYDNCTGNPGSEDQQYNVLLYVQGDRNPCPEDLNGDGTVDLTDLSILLGNFGGAGAGDIDGNGFVDLTDLSLLLAAFGTNC